MNRSARRNAPCSCQSGKPFRDCCGKSIKLLAQPTKEIINAPAVTLLTPSRGACRVEFVKAMGFTDNLPTLSFIEIGKGVIEARNTLAAQALKCKDAAPFTPTEWYAIWADDDAYWISGTFTRLLTALQSPDVDIVAGWFGPRKEHAAPKAFYRDGTYPNPDADGIERGTLVEVSHIGFHFVAMKHSVLEKIGPDPFTPKGEEGEDIAFCNRALELGMRIWTHTGVPVGHMGEVQIDGTGDRNVYLPFMKPLLIDGVNMVEKLDPRKYEATA